MIGLRSLRKRGRSSALVAMPTTSFRWVKFAMSSRIFVSSDLRSVRMKVMSTNFSFVPGLYRLCSRSASQQIESVLPLPAEWSARYFLPMSPLVAKMGRDVLGHTTHQTALMVAWEHRERWAFRLVV